MPLHEMPVVTDEHGHDVPQKQFASYCDGYRFRLENSFDGGKTWHTFMTGVYRRA